MMKEAGINHKKASSLKQSLNNTGSLPSSLNSRKQIQMSSGGSRGTAKGGKISSDTQKLLETMMKEAGINHKKASSLKQSLNNTGSLPSSLNSTLSSSSAVSVGKQFSASSMGSYGQQPVHPRNCDRGRRSKAAIDDKVARDPEQRSGPGGAPGINRDAEKARFAALMQYEGDVPSVRPREELNTRTKHYCPRGSNLLAEPGSSHPSALRELQQKRFADLAREVEENQQFLHEMSKAGQADKYTFQVNGTIAEKTREMRELDAKLSEP